MPMSIETLVFFAFLIGVAWSSILLKLIGFDILGRINATDGRN